MNVTLFWVSANKISVFSITQQSRLLFRSINYSNTLTGEFSTVFNITIEPLKSFGSWDIILDNNDINNIASNSFLDGMKASVTIMADFSPEFNPPVRWRSKHQTKNDC